MLKRLPLVATILVLLAVATMVGLGIWQLQRAYWKEGLLARLEANRGLPEIAYPAVPVADDTLLFRRAAGFCPGPVSIRATAGRNIADDSGWSHIATCRTGGLEDPSMIVDIGWSAALGAPVWAGGAVAGIIVPDSRHLIRLVATTPAPGLQPSQPPGPSTIPNNHRFYAAQWFFFAAAAGLIYWLAVRKRLRNPAEDNGS